jgi:hypothetical protein
MLIFSQLLLALALFQLRHVPHSNGTKKEALQRGKYPLIAEHFLPGKTLVQIRNHMVFTSSFLSNKKYPLSFLKKNVRASPSPSIIQKIICQAERGIFHAKYKPDLGETARQEIPINWPNDLQPFWLKVGWGFCTIYPSPIPINIIYDYISSVLLNCLNKIKWRLQQCPWNPPLIRMKMTNLSMRIQLPFLINP